ncbi:hypothetical protein Tco_0878623 [Tanacetum coccineum]|uniref:Uncharacterized protein n=1 Tax=Tanacetum coccineum TaxID=301880 RepID=A0ABQ5C1P0_9ASTR
MLTISIGGITLTKTGRAISTKTEVEILISPISVRINFIDPRLISIQLSSPVPQDTQCHQEEDFDNYVQGFDAIMRKHAIISSKTRGLGTLPGNTVITLRTDLMGILPEAVGAYQGPPNSYFVSSESQYRGDIRAEHPSCSTNKTTKLLFPLPYPSREQCLHHLEYAFLEGDKQVARLIAKELDVEENRSRKVPGLGPVQLMYKDGSIHVRIAPLGFLTPKKFDFKVIDTNGAEKLEGRSFCTDWENTYENVNDL